MKRFSRRIRKTTPNLCDKMVVKYHIYGLVCVCKCEFMHLNEIEGSKHVGLKLLYLIKLPWIHLITHIFWLFNLCCEWVFQKRILAIIFAFNYVNMTCCVYEFGLNAHECAVVGIFIVWLEIMQVLVNEEIYCRVNIIVSSTLH